MSRRGKMNSYWLGIRREFIISPPELARYGNLSYGLEALGLLQATFPSPEEVGWCVGSGHTLIPGPPVAMSLQDLIEQFTGRFTNTTKGLAADGLVPATDTVEPRWYSIGQRLPTCNGDVSDMARRLKDCEEGEIPGVCEIIWLRLAMMVLREERQRAGLYPLHVPAICDVNGVKKEYSVAFGDSFIAVSRGWKKMEVANDSGWIGIRPDFKRQCLYGVKRY